MVSQWLGFLSESVKQWQALVAGGADPNAYLLCLLFVSRAVSAALTPWQGGQERSNSAARGQRAWQLASGGLPPTRYCRLAESRLIGVVCCAVLASLSWGLFPSAGLVTKINARDRWGRTALDLAIVGGHKEVEVLLSAHEAIAVAREEEEPCDLLPACEKPPRGCPLLQMPTEMLVLILSWLEPRDLCAVAQTCSVIPPPLHFPAVVCTRL